MAVRIPAAAANDRRDADRTADALPARRTLHGDRSAVGRRYALVLGSRVSLQTRRDSRNHSTSSISRRTTGTYLGRCAQFCGLEHAMMTFSVTVVPRSGIRALPRFPERSARDRLADHDRSQEDRHHVRRGDDRFFRLAGVLAMLIRAQLARARQQFTHPHEYNQIFTLHGTAMIFFVIAPFGLAGELSGALADRRARHGVSAAQRESLWLFVFRRHQRSLAVSPLTAARQPPDGPRTRRSPRS